ncbi:hypothetical protein fHeYen902_319c [Yersinia phage fHe-Yen9-02]|nr:hypothetical protein fHeYen902_319c [Yersinia phage fHe-Yen9-02]
MKVFGILDLAAGGLSNFSFSTATEYPATPKPGTTIFIDKRLMLCVSTEDGLPMWVPLTQQMTMYTHHQTSASSRWEVKHNINYGTPMVQVYDSTGEVIIPTSIKVEDSNTVIILLSESLAGAAVVLVGIENGLPHQTVAFTESFTSLSSWVVVHNLGYNPAVNVYQGNVLVQPQSIVHDSTSQLTITFSSPQSGTVILY